MHVNSMIEGESQSGSPETEVQYIREMHPTNSHSYLTIDGPVGP